MHKHKSNYVTSFSLHFQEGQKQLLLAVLLHEQASKRQLLPPPTFTISFFRLPTRTTASMASTLTTTAAATADDIRTAQYAREAALLLQPLVESPELAALQRLRAHDLEESLFSVNDRRKLNSRDMAACSYCGTLMVPGWTGSMRVSRIKPGKRKRKQCNVASSDKRNRLEWTCSMSCGRTLLQAGSDPNTKAKFAPVKKHSPFSVLLQRHVVQASRRSTHDAELAKRRLAPALQDQGQPASPAPSIAKKQASPQLPAQSPKLSPFPSSSSLPMPKKKRTKREGLQAMLQAKREQEEKAKQAAGSLGLSSFLKGLQ